MKRDRWQDIVSSIILIVEANLLVEFFHISVDFFRKGEYDWMMMAALGVLFLGYLFHEGITNIN